MLVYIYICIYIYIYLHVHMYVCIHAKRHYSQVCTCLTCLMQHQQAYTCLRRLTDINSLIQNPLSTCPHALVHTRTKIHMYTQKYVYSPKYIHTNIKSLAYIYSTILGDLAHTLLCPVYVYISTYTPMTHIYYYYLPIYSDTYLHIMTVMGELAYIYHYYLPI
jgi:hypothetical protein